MSTRTRSSDPRFDAIRRRGGARYAALLEAGYREWYTNTGKYLTPFLLCKDIRGDDGTKLYQICVWAYDFSDCRPENPVNFQAEVQYNVHGHQSPTFDVALHDGGQAPEEIEEFFAVVYGVMECKPYDEESP